MSEHNKLPESYYRLLHDLQAVDFVLVELTLYLNTHPDDAAAVEQFNVYAAKKQHLKAQFDAEFGPLQQFGNSPVGVPFTWKEAPWPWQV
ncbi:spore coat protein CotJB [Tumebacillus sp. ITR2]|uniref:Spore coat protein CotJB n=1 Tax=Tumebacillus amylolyticus TaxID=2801339 RepID=A0ABS1J880_9BACL|nr:spore coat protein CotJB [Tumebacillus amylolyticus]MBL0386492.1 spore coat protein CotJB [Tumebacillus amylolyticus]